MDGFRNLLLLIAILSLGGCVSTQTGAPESGTNLSPVHAAHSQPRPPFSFSKTDEELLTEIQRGAFRYLWEVNDPATGMVLDRTSKPHVSVAGVGFQLAAIPAAIERGWISREAGKARVLKITSTLAAHPEIRIDGVFSHFIDSRTGSLMSDAPESVASTVDSALLFSGMIVASAYFGNEVASAIDPLIEGVNWKSFVAGPEANPWEQGFISLGKRMGTREDKKNGQILPYYWVDAGCEHRLVTFLAVGASHPEFAVSPEVYYTLRRPLGDGGTAGPFVYFPFSGAMFTAQFSHCFMNYARWGADDPAKQGITHRRSVDWWENSRRITRFHFDRSQTIPIPGFGPHSWGFTASDCPEGYQVPGLYPKRIPEQSEQPEFDFSTFVPKEDFGDGTISPYAAGCSILFEPELAVAALRHYRSLKLSDGRSIWADPSLPRESGGGFGLADAFREAKAGQKAWIDPDHLAIDQGPLMLAIENARSGLIWRLFESHNLVIRAKQRLGIRD